MLKIFSIEKLAFYKAGNKKGGFDNFFFCVMVCLHVVQYRGCSMKKFLMMFLFCMEIKGN